MRRSRSTADLAVDLGTSNLRLVARGQGVIWQGPSVVATQPGVRGREIVAFGDDAKRMIGRAPKGIQVTRPVRRGVIADFQAAEQLLSAVLKSRRGMGKPRVLVCIPTGTTEVERRAVQESTRAAGAKEVLLTPTPLAAALGAGLPISEPVGSMIIDVGGGRSDVGITSLGGLVSKRSVMVAGDSLDDLLGTWLRKEHNLLVGERTTEALKLRLGAACAGRGQVMRVRGRDLPTSQPRELDVQSDDTFAAYRPTLKRIVDSVLEVLRDAPPEISADILDRGALLCGGTSHLYGLEAVLREATGLPILQAERPDDCVALGAAQLLDDPSLFERVTQAP